MLPIGSDRVRVAGVRVILQSRLPKGWVPRRQKEGTHAEFPGTAVLWDEEYLEVVSAEALPSGGVRYVLEPWREDHTIRVFEAYSEESEARLLAAHQTAQKQRRSSLAARLSGVVLGHLPGSVQQRLANELGVSPVALTLSSMIPPLLLFGFCVYASAGSFIAQTNSRLPAWLVVFSFFWFVETLIRFYLVMSLPHGVGSVLGILVYAVTHPRELVRNSAAPATPAIEVAPEVAAKDTLTLWGPLLALLPVVEQRRLAERYGFNYREHAYVLAWIILGGSALGITSAVSALFYSFRLSALLSLLVALVLAGEQIVRIQRFPRGPAGSLLGVLVRPFARSLLERQ